MLKQISSLYVDMLGKAPQHLIDVPGDGKAATLHQLQGSGFCQHQNGCIIDAGKLACLKMHMHVEQQALSTGDNKTEVRCTLE